MLYNLLQFLSTSKTSRNAWNILAKTYASESRDCITTHRTNLASPQQGTRSVTDYMQDIKRNIDALALMDVAVDFDELSIRILNGLSPTYTELSHEIQARDTDNDFDELFEKLFYSIMRLN